MENINEIIHSAFINSNKDLKISNELTLKAATMDAAWKKHGIKSNSSSHIVFDGKGKEKEIREDFESMLFIQGTDSENLGVKGKWKTSFFSASKNLLIARVELDSFWSNFNAMLGATKIENVPEDTVCTVKELGFHPTLTCKGELFYTTEITAIIELDGSKDSDLGEACNRLKGEPVLVTWFPGRQLPTSTPTDCKVGDVMTAAEAKAKGWNTVSFTA
jgi:hypothetical protein